MKKLTDEERRERRERGRECNRLHYLENKDKIKERRRLYYLKNKDKIKERRRQYYLKNKDKDVIPLKPMDMTKREIEALEAKIARLKAKPLEELIYQRV